MYEFNQDADELIIDGYIYKLIRIGSGGNADVYKVIDYMPEVVIKVLKKGYSVNDLLRFKREIKILKELSNQDLNIPFIYSELLDEQNDTFSYIMEYNESISNYIKILPTLTIEERLHLLNNFAKLIDSIHKKNIYHRDIKSSNILYDSFRGFILCDFGIAFPLEEEVITITEAPGNNILPSHFRHDNDFNTRKNKYIYDIYLLGVFVWEVLVLSKWGVGRNGTSYDELDKKYNTSFYYTKDEKTNFNINYINELLTKTISKNEDTIIKIEEVLNIFSQLGQTRTDNTYFLDKSFGDVFIALIKYQSSMYVDEFEINGNQYEFFNDSELYAVKKTDTYPWETDNISIQVYSIELFKIVYLDNYLIIEFNLLCRENNKNTKVSVKLLKNEDVDNIMIDLHREISLLRA